MAAEQWSSDDSVSDPQDGEVQMGSPLPWLSVDGFQIALWHCFHYCPSSIPFVYLPIFHTILQLLSSRGHGDFVPVGTLLREAVPICSHLTCDAVELLIRFALRKRDSFTYQQVDAAFSDHLKVRPSLALLQVISVDSSVGEGTSCGGECFVTCYSGDSVAKLLTTSQLSETEVMVSRRILNAVNAPDLRRVATELSRSANETLLVPAAAVPGRKEEIIDFLLNQEYRNVGHSSISSEPLRQALTDIWDSQVGVVIVLSLTVKKALWFAASLFHILTSNFLASSIFASDRFSLKSSVVAHPPGMLLHYYQRVILQHYRFSRCSVDSLQGKKDGSSDHRAADSVKLLEWSTMLPSLGSNNVLIFHSADYLSTYLSALQLHESLFFVTDGAANFAQTLRGRDKDYVKGIFDSITALLDQCHASRQVSKEEYELVNRKRYNSATANEKETMASVVYREGLGASHLLQFTPQYRLYAALELLFPLLEYLKMYAEAIHCLRVLLYRPLFNIYPQQRGDFSEVKSSPAVFSFLYRYEKRGEWWCRLAIDYNHVGESAKGLQLLTDVHTRWKEASSLLPDVQRFVSQLSRSALSMEQHIMEGAPHSPPAAYKDLQFSFASAVNRRSRMLRALWPNDSRCNADAFIHFHAAMEWILVRYCHRADLLSMEKTISSLHKKVSRWTPLPPAHLAFTTSIRHPKTLRVDGVRDLNNVKGWRDPSRVNSFTSSVEEMVLQHFLHTFNSRDAATTSSGSSVEPGWNGVHCEGRWIAVLLRILFWDCFYSGLEGGDDSAPTTPHAGAVPLAPHVWLSHFQEGPLDASTPIFFSQRRSDTIELRLKYLETLDDAAFMNEVTSHIKGNRKRSSSEADDEDRWRLSLDGRRLPFSPINSCLVEMVGSIPRKPLLQLLRYMLLRQLFDGHSTSPSGFPDLVLWKATSASPTPATFQLMEVKSPHDELSTKQIAVNDTLLRCGFEVFVVRVVSVEQ